MSDRVKTAICCIVIFVSIAATVTLYHMMPACDQCGRKFCFGECAFSQDALIRPGSPMNAKTNQKTTRLASTEAVDLEEYFENVWLIGDSRTNALQLHGVPVDRILAQDGMNQEQAVTTSFIRIGDSMPVTIPEAVMYSAPEIVVVNFGINGISWWSVEDFMTRYETLIEALREASPSTIIVIESVLPVSMSYEESSDANGLTNEKIDEVNEALYQYARQNGYYYMASNEVMKNEYNDLKREYSEDGVHFTKAGCEAIVEYILTHAIIKEK